MKIVYLILLFISIIIHLFYMRYNLNTSNEYRDFSLCYSSVYMYLFYNLRKK